MQFAKDSFFLALQQRLAALNPGRTVTINGTTVPAIVAVENIPPSSGEPQPNTFYLEWGSASIVDGHAGNSALLGLGCAISYYSLGTVASMVDRGRVLGQLDAELLAMCQPPSTEKMDYSRSPSADLGTKVFWSQPAFDEAVTSGVEDDTLNYTARGARKVLYTQAYQDGRVARRAQLTVFFFSEVTLL